MSTLPATSRKTNPVALALLFALAVFFLSILTYHTWQQCNERFKVEMKSGGKNAKHANQKAKDVAKDKYKEVKTEFEKLEIKPNKSPEEKVLLEKWRTKMKHWQKKKDWSGEQHAQKNKGN